jgi:hypothetical protein
MTRNEIEHMWKVASNNPNHDTNWHDPVVEAFAKLVAKHTLLNTDPSSFMSYQEGYEAGRQAEREACAKVCEELLDRPSGYQGTWEGYGKFKTQMTGQECAAAIRARSNT